MRILITGGAGYVGSILCEHLLASGYQVVVLDNLMHGQASLGHLIANPGMEAYRGDARNSETMMRLLRRADALIPLAAIVGAPACDADPTAAESTNTEAVATALRLMSPDQIVLYPNTNSGYGIGQPGVPCTEESAFNPLSLYARTKVDAEQICLDRGNAVVFRLATVFGMSPRMRLDLLVNDFVNRALRDRAVVLYEARAMRNYIHVRDVALAFIHVIENFATMRDAVYNVGLSDENLSKLDLCARIRNHVPHFVFVEAPVGEDPDKRDYVVSNAKIEATGFRSMFSLDDGIAELVRGIPMLGGRLHGNV